MKRESLGLHYNLYKIEGIEAVNKEVNSEDVVVHPSSSRCRFSGVAPTGVPGPPPKIEELRKPFARSMSLFMGSESLTTKAGLGHT